ncbi:hypothetical protein Fmac_016150 [Flemingia macrophylla]|uniref:Uncharacterized protein n=1 Tax=Flemingia macrophylla TaxID=520843 RepID=A0ABD1MHA1_9FABA
MKVLGRKAWHVGPLSLCTRDTQEKANKGKEASHECLKWLETKWDFMEGSGQGCEEDKIGEEVTQMRQSKGVTVFTTS